jgi:hypothetical protein
MYRVTGRAIQPAAKTRKGATMAVWTFQPSATFDADQAERVAVFAKIEPAGNWKNPIDAWIDAGDFADCDQAAVWFTGAGLTIVARKAGRVRVTAPGYYATIGA